MLREANYDPVITGGKLLGPQKGLKVAKKKLRIL